MLLVFCSRRWSWSRGLGFEELWSSWWVRNVLTEPSFGCSGMFGVWWGLFERLWAVPATSFLLQALWGPSVFPFSPRELLHEVERFSQCLISSLVLSPQLVSEKVGGAEGTKLDDDFKEMEKVSGEPEESPSSPRGSCGIG